MEISYSENQVVILGGIILFETAIIFGDWINSRATRNPNTNSRFFGFTLSDYIELGFSFAFLIAIMGFIFLVVFPLSTGVSDMLKTNGERALPYFSITLAFMAMSVTLFFRGVSDVNDIFTKVTNRNRSLALNEKLERIEASLVRIENR